MTSLCFNLPKSKFQIIVTISLNSPDGPVVKNPPSNAGGSGLIPGQGMKIQHAVQPKKKKKKKGQGRPGLQHHKYLGCPVCTGWPSQANPCGKNCVPFIYPSDIDACLTF